MIPDLAFAVK